MVAHRRFGKTVGCINDDIRACLESRHWRTGKRLESYRAAYIAPLLKQAKAIAWDYVKEYTRTIPNVKYNESELRVDFPNGARYRLYGADNPDSLRGLYFDRVTEDEPADMRVGFHSTVILPALADREGRCTKIGTPKGHNEFYDDYQRGVDDPDTFTAIYKASETGVLPESELHQLKVNMSQDQYEQELECSFEAAVQGAYYGRIIKAMEEKGQIRDVPHDPAVCVDVFFDIGFNDAMSMWFVQQDRLGNDRVIDFYENSGEAIPHYAGILNDKKAQGYLYGTIVFPHDGANHSVQTGQTNQEKMYECGYRVEVLPRTKNRMEDIELCRTTLPKLFFDKERCHQGLEALKQYRKKYNDKTQTYQDRPHHDWTSNAADAFRMYVVWRKENSYHGASIIEVDTSWVT